MVIFNESHIKYPYNGVFTENAKKSLNSKTMLSMRFTQIMTFAEAETKFIHKKYSFVVDFFKQRCGENLISFYVTAINRPWISLQSKQLVRSKGNKNGNQMLTALFLRIKIDKIRCKFLRCSINNALRY